MGKLSNYRIYIILAILAACIALVFLTRSCVSDREIQATFNSLDIHLKEGSAVLEYSDNTKGAHTWLWEFGDGSTSDEQSGEYAYRKPGKYQIRLTVDDKLEKEFLVNVLPEPATFNPNQFIRIIAPTSAMQGEHITFRGEGSSKEWRWEFGKTGMIDAHGKNVIYCYDIPDTYEVLLTTEETQYPVRHLIVIEPCYSDVDTLSNDAKISSDIQKKLQAIIDQEPFKKNYDEIRQYLCNRDNDNGHNCLVVVNNNKKNDLYSYCQGLRLRRKRTKIEAVLIEGDSCVIKLDVLQTDLD